MNTCRLTILFLLVVEMGIATDVRNFGAIGDGRADDTVPIQNAIDAANPGDTLIFNAGTYRLTGSLHLKGGVTYKGVDNPVLMGYQGHDYGGYALAMGEYVSDVTVTGLTFDGGGLVFVQNDWMRNIVITGNAFQNITSRGTDDESQHVGVFLDHVANVTISGNKFTNIIDGGGPYVFSDGRPLANGVKFYHASQITIADNRIDFVGQGISMGQIGYYDPCDCADINILRNTFTNVFRMAIEIQGGLPGHPLSDVLIEDNVATMWLRPYADTAGISFAPYTATNAVIRRNYLDAWPSAPNSSEFWRYGFCLEVDGEGTLVEGNTCVSTGSTKGWGWSLAGPHNMAVAISGRDVIFRDNVICDGPVSIGYESPHPELLGHPAQVYGNTYPDCGTSSPIPMQIEMLRSQRPQRPLTLPKQKYE
jgi:hypothetical protein